MAELADALDLGSNAARRAGSSPVTRTIDVIWGAFMRFEVIRANIVHVPADAIVLPANEALREGAGASRDIFQAAGK